MSPGVDRAWRGALVALLLPAGVAHAASNGYPKVFFQKGVNFTAEVPAGYSLPASTRILDQLPPYGVNAVALVPYGFYRSQDVTIHFGGANLEAPELVEGVAALAHSRGMKVMLKPQIWSQSGFAGDIELTAQPQRAKFFEQYRSFLEFYAELATRIHADIFCVGVELAKMTPHEAEWRKLIARARQLYAGPLVYAAIQGPEFENIQFWDALDYIGLNNYYPLPDDLSTGAVVRKVEAVERRFKRPVIFPEAGFCSMKSPHRAPWDETPRELSLTDQARCYEAIFQAFYRKPWFKGMYWWKVGTDGRGGPHDGSHTPWGKPAMDILAKWYK
jgi:hypothetical protein